MDRTLRRRHRGSRTPPRSGQGAAPFVARPRAGLLLPLATACALAAGTALGCAGSAKPAAPTVDLTRRPDLEAYAYRCEKTGEAVSRYDAKANVMWVSFANRTVRLEQVEAASGARYASGDVTFWTHQGEARLIRHGRSERCVQDLERTQIVRAEARGVFFRGVGNEPGWVLDIGPKWITLTTDYDQRSFRFLTPPAATDATSGAKTYAMADGRHELHVTVTPKPCRDDRSGEAFPEAVELVIDGQPLHGCGRPLD